MKYWLVKTEPGTYSWEDLEKDKQTPWDGVRNYQARNNLQLMEKGDQVLVYHSGKDKAVQGLTEVVKAGYQDPTTDDDHWVAVDLRKKQKLKTSVSLKEIKAEGALKDVALIRHTRLSVMPLTKAEFDTIVSMGGGLK